MLRLTGSLAAWNTPQFEQQLKQELLELGRERLPLQEALTQSSHVGSGDISILVLNTLDAGEKIRIKAGVFYPGIIAGSCCSDDPTPNCEVTEYCELQVEIDKQSGESTITLLPG